MIASDVEYRIAKSEAEKFEQALVAAREREPSPGVDPRVHGAIIESLESELAILCEQLARYEASAGKSG